MRLLDKAILYFHGGGFRIGSVASHRDLIAQIAVASGCRVLAINYRLAPEHRFPAALDDALAAYGWMLDHGLKPDNIAFAGDSAGGNLVLAAMLALRERGLPLPVSAVLMSPWTDLAATGASYVSRAEADPIHQRPMILALAKNYLGGQGDPLRSAGITAICRPQGLAAAPDPGRRPRNRAGRFRHVCRQGARRRRRC